MIHATYCRTQVHSDVAKRLHDIYMMHRMADPIGNIGKWFAVAIADGTTDNILYDTRGDAVRYQHHNEMYSAYVQVVPGEISICDAELFMSGVRKTYQARKALMDRDHSNGGMEIIPRLAVEDQIAQNNGKPTNLIIPERNAH
jgi:hypothetical protein